jgi:hypothetical protein
MTTLKLTFPSASYDEDVEFLVTDTPKVRRALQLRAELIAECGDGSQDVVELRGIAPADDEADFLDWLVTDISGGDDAEIWAALDREAN